MRKKKAFTLSEVLITLVVIGVIAAIALPTLIADWHKQETISRLKKIYSTLSQTTNRAITDNGPILTWEIEHYNSTPFAETFLLPYLNISKNYKMNEDNTFNYEYKTMNNVISTMDRNYYRFFLTDGTLMGVYPFISDAGYIYANVFVDINGNKGPNRMGRDVFFYRYHIKHLAYPNEPIYHGNFVPVGGGNPKENLLNDERYGCNHKGGTGIYCAAVIMVDGWQISDDYPW